MTPDDPPQVWKPNRAQLEAARTKHVPDLIAPNLKVLLIGINPGLYSAAIGHHFGRPGNRFWPTLHQAGISHRLLSPFEDAELLESGYGITNVVPRTTAAADELLPEELIAGAARLRAKIKRLKPRIAAFVGAGAYRTGFRRPRAKMGPQVERFGITRIWVLPNPSGLNAHYQLPHLAELFRELREAAEQS